MGTSVTKSLILGTAGVGKTHLKHLLLNKDPPQLRVSTGLADNPVRAICFTLAGPVYKWKCTIIEDQTGDLSKGAGDVVIRVLTGPSSSADRAQPALCLLPTCCFIAVCMSSPLRGLASTYSLQSSKWLSSGGWTLVGTQNVKAEAGNNLIHYHGHTHPADILVPNWSERSDGLGTPWLCRGVLWPSSAVRRSGGVVRNLATSLNESHLMVRWTFIPSPGCGFMPGSHPDQRTTEARLIDDSFFTKYGHPLYIQCSMMTTPTEPSIILWFEEIKSGHGIALDIRANAL
eukprot:Em0017g162a